MMIHYCYDENAKRRIASQFKAQLRKVATALGLDKDQYDLRFNPGGIAVWGEVTLHTDKWYVQASRGCDMGVLVRTCKGRRDYTGGMNHYLPFALLRDNPQGFAASVQALRY